MLGEHHTSPRSRQGLAFPARHASLRGGQGLGLGRRQQVEDDNSHGGSTASSNVSSSGGGVSSAAYFSSAGPTADGRRKPDLMAPGWWIYSAVSLDGNDYLSDGGTGSGGGTSGYDRSAGSCSVNRQRGRWMNGSVNGSVSGGYSTSFLFYS